MKVKLSKAPRGLFAVLIPSKGRPDVLGKTLEKQPFLDRSSTYIGIETKETKLYAGLRDRYRNIRWIRFDNPEGSGCVAREALRVVAVEDGYDFYVPTDDNARYTEQSLQNLVRAGVAFPRPCIVSGFHGLAPRNDAAAIKHAKEYGGLHFYWKWGAIFWSIPHSVYSQMSYPSDGGRMDDRYVTFAALSQGIVDWVVCMEAPYVKATGQKGGYTGAGRTRMMGQSLMSLGRDYPEYMEKTTVSFPWKKIVERVTGEKPWQSYEKLVVRKPRR